MSLEFTEVGGVVSNVKITIGLSTDEIANITRFKTDNLVTGEDLLVVDNFLNLSEYHKNIVVTGKRKRPNSTIIDDLIQYGPGYRFYRYQPKWDVWMPDVDPTSPGELNFVDPVSNKKIYVRGIVSVRELGKMLVAPDEDLFMGQGLGVRQPDFAAFDRNIKYREDVDDFSKMSQVTIAANAKLPTIAEGTTSKFEEAIIRLNKLFDKEHP